jgi:hypothetical protein
MDFLAPPVSRAQAFVRRQTSRFLKFCRHGTWVVKSRVRGQWRAQLVRSRVSPQSSCQTAHRGARFFHSQEVKSDEFSERQNTVIKFTARSGGDHSSTYPVRPEWLAGLSRHRWRRRVHGLSSGDAHAESVADSHTVAQPVGYAESESFGNAESESEPKSVA